MYQFSIICTRTTFVLDSKYRLDGWIKDALLDGEIKEAEAYMYVQHYGQRCCSTMQSMELGIPHVCVD